MIDWQVANPILCTEWASRRQPERSFHVFIVTGMIEKKKSAIPKPYFLA